MPFNVVRRFEQAVGEYTGAPYVVSVTSCTMALLLAVKWYLTGPKRKPPPIEYSIQKQDQAGEWYREAAIEIPNRTYVSVPMSIIHAGGRPTFRDEQWVGGYQLNPLPVWDYARRFTSGMYVAGQMQCLSFHAAKILGDTQGGAILLDDPLADSWLRRMRFDGRTEGVAPKLDSFREIGYHCYLSPDVAARLLMKLSVTKKVNADLPWDEYPNLAELDIFK